MSALGCEHASPRGWCAECEVKELRAQLARAEKQLADTGLAHKELVGLSLRYDRLEAQLAETQAQAAAVRSALEDEDIEHPQTCPTWRGDGPPACTCGASARATVVSDALAGDAGRALLEWTKLAVEALEKAEWGHPDEDQAGYCPCCGAPEFLTAELHQSPKPGVHKPDCLIRKALETAPGVKP